MDPIHLENNMFFNSIPFAFFLISFFLLYWFMFQKNLNAQNLLLLLGSYFFYSWWDVRFLSLIIASTLLDYTIGLAMEKYSEKHWRKFLLCTSIFFNLGILAYFKYFNFFIESWVEVWSTLGVQMHIETLNIILPVGISFYTFQTLSYTIDVYRNTIIPTRNLVQFSTYVAFFPQLVAGPIERASNLLPQFAKKRKFTYKDGKKGLNLILWGLFQKMVIADNCATYVNAIFNGSQNLNSLSLFLGAFYFAFQIYGDFAGYSNIAIGTARVLGFRLMQNFNYPYFSRNIAEFWRRWHISLSTWFRDYLYIPLGGSRGTLLKRVRNIFIIFLVSGLWHGANWTFVMWGSIHALLFLPLLIKNSNRKYLNTNPIKGVFVNAKDLIRILMTLSFTCFAWIFFRSPSIEASINYIKRMLTNGSFNIEFLPIERYSIEFLLLIALFVAIEWRYRFQEEPISGRADYFKSIAVILIILAVGVFSEHSDFIYFQF